MSASAAERADRALQNSEKLIREEADASQVSKKTKDRSRKVLSAIQQTIDVIEGAAELHPLAKLAVTTFKGLLKLELNRRDNNEQIVIVCHTMTRALITFTSIPTQEGAAEQGSDVYNELTVEIEACCKTMEEFGTFSDAYYNKFNKSRLVRFLRATDFKQKLKSYADRFNEHRAQLSFILSVTETISLGTISSDIERILDRLGIPSTKAEKRAAAEIQQRGGAEAVCLEQNRTELQSIAKILDDSDSAVTTITMEALTTDIDDLLAKNHDSFMSKLKAAQEEIVESINRSTDMIMKQLTDGPWEIIKDADVREVWRVNNWKLGVKFRQFVDSLYTHFATSPRLQDPSDPAEDSWTLKVIAKVINHPAIGEAIDEDASGFLSIHEVNHFLLKKPVECTTPMWLVFWGIGWRYMNEVYTAEINDMLETLKSNCEALENRLRGDTDDEAESDTTITTHLLDAIKRLEYVMEWIDHVDAADDDGILADYDTDTAGNIAELAQSISGSFLTRLSNNFAANDYEIDDASLATIVGESDVRIELFLMPLLYVLLERLLKLFDIEAEESGKGDPEAMNNFIGQVYLMNNNIYEVLYAFTERMKSLLRSWRSQKLNTELQVECYAGGLMYGWWKKYETSENEFNGFLYSDSESDSDDDSDIGNDTERKDGTENPAALSTDDRIIELSTRVDGLDSQLVKMESMLAQILAALSTQVGAVEMRFSEGSGRGGGYGDGGDGGGDGGGDY